MDSRPPRRPVLDLPRETVQEDEPFELSQGLSAEQDEDEPLPELTPPYTPAEAFAEDEPMELTSAEFAEENEPASLEEHPAEPAATDTATYDYGNEDDDFDDVDDIVDPLAGLRNEHTERFEQNAFTRGSAAEREPLDLGGGEVEEGEGGEDALDFGEYGNPLQPKRRQPIVPGGGGGGDAGSGGGGGGAVPPGNTLFERMANLSRGSGSPARGEDGDDDDDDPGSPTLNIPRFLGRQNNQ